MKNPGINDLYHIDTHSPVGRAEIERLLTSSSYAPIAHWILGILDTHEIELAALQREVEKAYNLADL